MDIREQIRDWDCEEPVTELATELIRMPSVNPPGDMRAIATLIQEHLRGIGLTVERFEPKPGVVSLIGRLEAGSGPTLILNGHMDVVPVGERDRWSWDPFGGERREGYLLGRGASDMKGGLAALLVALSMVASFKELRGSVLFMAVPDEETGGELGTRFLLVLDHVLGAEELPCLHRCLRQGTGRTGP